MRVAFKEWAIVVDALGRGDQILILRKGGIHEGRQGFRPEHAEFLLFPTAFHQQGESVISAARERFQKLQPSLSPDEVRLEYFAQVTSWKRLENLQTALALEGQHIWSQETIRDRFDWGKENGIYALIVRVHRLPQLISIPNLAEYRGCKSWITLPMEIDVTASQPVLTEKDFETRQTRLLDLIAENNPLTV